MKSPLADIQLKKFSVCNVYGAILVDERLNKDGLHNVRYRLTYRRERKYIATGYAYSLDDWERITSNKVRDEKLKKDKISILNGFEVIADKINEVVNEDRKPFK
jgi:hypothetical protein